MAETLLFFFFVFLSDILSWFWGLGSSLKYWLRCNGIILLGQNNNPAKTQRINSLKDSRPEYIFWIGFPTLVDTTLWLFWGTSIKARQAGLMVDAKVNRPIWDCRVYGLSMPTIYIYIYIFAYIYIASVSEFMPFAISVHMHEPHQHEGAPPNADSYIPHRNIYLRTPFQESIYTDIR